jgi:hypothetical protein
VLIIQLLYNQGGPTPFVGYVQLLSQCFSSTPQGCRYSVHCLARVEAVSPASWSTHDISRRHVVSDCERQNCQLWGVCSNFTTFFRMKGRGLVERLIFLWTYYVRQYNVWQFSSESEIEKYMVWLLRDLGMVWNKMWEPRPLITLWAFTACYRDGFTFTLLLLF